MIPEYGTEVMGKNGKVLGTVVNLAQNLITGEISRFVVRREWPEQDLFLSLDDVLEATGNGLRLKLSFEELSQRYSTPVCQPSNTNPTMKPKVILAPH